MPCERKRQSVPGERQSDPGERMRGDGFEGARPRVRAARHEKRITRAALHERITRAARHKRRGEARGPTEPEMEMRRKTREA